MKILVIVESPAKCKTIAKYLAQLKDGHTYTVMASVGHVRDLKKKELGIDVEHGFKPDYAVMEDKQEVIGKLRAAVSQHQRVLLATDQDREGESIAWHLQQILGLKASQYDRITFNEITPSALEAALKHPRKIDQSLVLAQQTRRILDRLVGFKLSPLLWRAFDTQGALKLSAGRVQSAAMKMIVDREHDIKQHVSTPYWTMQGEFKVSETAGFEDAKLYKDGTLFRWEKAEGPAGVERFLQNLENQFTLRAPLTLKKVREKPDAPFTTSTLQQEASAKLGFPIKRTMMVAQQLYEAGRITYMRTDSTQLSADASRQIQKEITRRYGSQLLFPGGRTYEGKKQKGAQEAHEAIRPSMMADYPLGGEEGDPVSMRKKDAKLGKEHKQLYDLIWKRTVASQMQDAVFHELSANIVDSSFVKLKSDVHFKGKVRSLIEPGYLTVYHTDRNNKHSNKEGDVAGALHEALIAQQQQHASKGTEKGKEATGLPVQCVQIAARNTWTGPPARYAESTLIKALEKAGVGRPSTYVSILTKLYEKQYVAKQNVEGQEVTLTHFTWMPKGKRAKLPGGITAERVTDKVHGELGKLVPTETGMHIDAFLREHFLDLVDSNFTATMEEQLDSIADGEQRDQDVLNLFWENFTERMLTYDAWKAAQIKAAKASRKKDPNGGGKIKLEQSKSTFTIDGKPYIVRLAKYGPVIQQDTTYWNLKPYLAAKKKGYMDVTEDDVRFAIGFPYRLPLQAELYLGPYGAYVKKDEENYMIPKTLMKQYDYQLENLVKITKQEVQQIVQAKADYLAKKKADASAPAPSKSRVARSVAQNGQPSKRGRMAPKL